jgi:propanol-preferring alcohol dehydrogenase
MGKRRTSTDGPSVDLRAGSVGNGAGIAEKVRCVPGAPAAWKRCEPLSFPFALTRSGDDQAQSLARELGAEWAGATEPGPPEELDAAIIFAPAGELVPLALRALAKGGTVVCAGIHMSDVPSFPYELLWEERRLFSVANLTRRDGEEFLALAPQVPVRTQVETHELGQANKALERLRAGRVRGAAVLLVDEG